MSYDPFEPLAFTHRGWRVALAPHVFHGVMGTMATAKDPLTKDEFWVWREGYGKAYEEVTRMLNRVCEFEVEELLKA